MKILIGTTNPSKVTRFSELLSDFNVTFCTLPELGIHTEPEEKGRTPEENAILKARYYGQFFDTVICNDSGLYFDALPLDDPRQPGLNVRTPAGHARLNDDEMLAYYSDLVHSLGGKTLAFYLDGIAVCRNGRVTSFQDDGKAARRSAFYMVDTPSPSGRRREGWPLDSISINRRTMRYFVDSYDSDSTIENVWVGDYKTRLVTFLVQSTLAISQ